MKPKQLDDTALKELLRKTLADDLPPDVAAGMRERLDRFRELTQKKETPSFVPLFLLRRTAWAALSVLMLVSGGLLQGLGSRSPLTDRLSAIGTSEIVSRRLTTVDSMSCSARVSKSDGTFLLYKIVWRQDRGTIVDVEGPNGTPLGKFEVGGSSRSLDPLLRNVVPLLDPSALGGLLSGEWRVVRVSREAGCDIGTYATLGADGRTAVEFTIDTCKDLPTRIRGSQGTPFNAGEPEKILWEARFDF